MSHAIGPEVSVALVLKVNEQVLLLRRPNGKYTFPGGHVEHNENIKEALKREIREELGLELTGEPKFIDLYEHIEPDGSQHILILHHLLIMQSQPAIQLGDDEKDSGILWLTKEELSKVVPNPSFIDKVFT